MKKPLISISHSFIHSEEKYSEDNLFRMFNAYKVITGTV